MTPNFNLLKNRFLLAIIISVAAAVILLLLLLKPTPQPTPTPVISYQNIQPGITTTSQLEKILGKPLKQTTKNNLIITEFPSTYPKNPHLAVTQDDKTALFIQKVSLQNNHSLSHYTSRFGNPQFTRYSTSLGPSYTLHIFLNQGVAVVAHDATINVVEVWYFQPQSLDKLLELSPIPLSTEPITEHSP